MNIDYGHGTTNIDLETGIRYGAISWASISPDMLGAFEPDYGDPTCPNCTGPVVDYDEEAHGEYKDVSTAYHYMLSCNSCPDYACELCELYMDAEAVYPEEPSVWYYEDEEYRVISMLDGSSYLVLKSPYYTWAEFCSPCIPGAGDLNSPAEIGQGAKTYCLGDDWFDSEHAPCPYGVMWHVCEEEEKT